MAHVAKYTQAQTAHLFNHYNRAQEKAYNRSNQDIDKSRTHENYNLMLREVTPQEYYKERLSELYKIDRSDVKVMCDWVVTLPRDYKGNTQEFFCHVVDFLNDRYGGINCIGAFVHLDEKQPHLHYSFIPVSEDKNPNHEQNEKVCAKEVLTRKDLTIFHNDLQSHLRERMPDKEINIITGITKEQGRNLSVQEMKLSAQLERVAEKEIELHERVERLEKKEEQLNRYEQTRNDYCNDRGLTQTQYERECFQARFTGELKPYPEIANPILSYEERKELCEKYKEQQEHDKEMERER